MNDIPIDPANRDRADTHPEDDLRRGKRNALLVVAAAEINAYGIGGASLSRIAQKAGMTRSALYYYFPSREDLALQCYARACTRQSADLDAAERSQGNGYDTLIAFIRAALDPDSEEVVALSELDALSAGAKQEIARAYTANVDRLRRVIRRGIEDGGLRACDDEIVAHSLFGFIAWTPQLLNWSSGPELATFRDRSVEALVDLFSNGIATDPAFRFEPSRSIAEFFPAPPRTFDKAGLAEARIEDLARTASQMFNRCGINGVSLEEITTQAGASKAAMYHYLKSKNDLVLRCYRRSYTLYDRFADAAKADSATGLQALLMGLYLNIQSHTSGLSPLAQIIGPAALPAAARREFQERSITLHEKYQSLYDLGIADGSLRKIDSSTFVMLSPGAFEWLPKWIGPEDARTPDGIATDIIGLFIRGLKTGR